MECTDIKALMSEYLDDALDARTKEVLEKHVSTCGACEEELVALRAVIHELGSLKPVAAPDDFLDRLQERLERESILERVRRKLFSPFHIKFPLELAGAAAVAVLVFAVLNTQLARKDMVPRSDIPSPARVPEAPRKKPIEQAFKKEKRMAASAVPRTPSEPAPGRDRVTAGKQVAKTAAPALTDKSAPTASFELKRSRPAQPADTLIELAVLIGPKDGEARIAREPTSDEYAEREGSIVAEERALTPASEGLSTLKGRAAWEDADPDALLTSIKSLIKDAAGEIVAVYYDERTRQLKHVTARIPTSNYGVFADTLSRLTTLQKRLPEPPHKDAETIRIRITFLYAD
jgi:anti-sigma factor RsiW